MAARTNKTELHERWRDKIRGSMLINHLRNHVYGRIKMSPTQLRAAEILLRKVFPDLTAVEHSGEVTQNHVARIPAVQDNAEQWQQQHSPDKPTIQ